MPEHDLEQLHADAIAAVHGKTLNDLDFTPTCDFHRLVYQVEMSAAFQLTCRRCHVVELRCMDCMRWWALRQHEQVECQECRYGGCFHRIVCVEQLGGAA